MKTRPNATLTFPHVHGCCSSRRSLKQAAPPNASTADAGAAVATTGHHDRHLVTDGREMFQRLLTRVKAQYDEYSAGRATAPPGD